MRITFLKNRWSCYFLLSHMTLFSVRLEMSSCLLGSNSVWDIASVRTCPPLSPTLTNDISPMNPSIEKKKTKKKNMLTNRHFSGAIQIKWKRKWFSIVNTHNSRIAQCTILYLLVRQIQCLAYSRRIPSLGFWNKIFLFLLSWTCVFKKY